MIGVAALLLLIFVLPWLIKKCYKMEDNALTINDDLKVLVAKEEYIDKKINEMDGRKSRVWSLIYVDITLIAIIGITYYLFSDRYWAELVYSMPHVFVTAPMAFLIILWTI